MKFYLDILISSWPLLTPALTLLISALTLLTLALAIYRFGLKRERFSSLNITIDTKVIHVSAEVQLISVIVKLENKGENRINARRERKPDGYLHNDKEDECVHAGTLKIRAVSIGNEQIIFDWYSLKPVRALIMRDEMDSAKGTEDILEQINYLGEYQDPEANFKEVHFWLEPKESYELHVPVWLRPGIYSAKAFFLAPMRKHQEEEYWSHTILFKVDPNLKPDQSLQRPPGGCL